ncbi:iron-sulfur cluster repair protein ScdA [Desulfuromonas sp. DDH964]|uniref:iron-sulfur cluster repair di-iron protein n=1 Tax=Desulfuromonas sp. DDH964 TaxID=1823759 RepID=UPI00078E046B|nr:iron-sulfur cluster repair di-iron protein [Desulfuromonas sp. DDH964]AMV72884.1 iron-sulfur cluster repair protein ScdA [Desulfuromonas sp. DDH964]
MNTVQKLPDVATQQQTIGEFVAADYRTATVFEKYGIDFCCGGQVSLAAACQERGLDPGAIAAELAAQRTAPLDRSQNFGAWELPFLADYIINTHHAYLHQETGQIAAYTRKIAGVHGGHHPEVLEIAALFDRIAADMTGHLRAEEEVLFPAIRRLAAAGQNGSLSRAADRTLIKRALETLHGEHEAIGAAAHAIRELAGGYAIPPGVCSTFVVSYRKLKEFEDDLHKHVHLENNILFLKAAEL